MNNLMAKKQWVCRKEDKTPIDPFTGYGAKCNDRGTWATWEQAFNACEKWDCVGVGVQFADGLAGVDIDSHHWEDGNPLADEILDMFDGTYMERSASGKGWHILFYVDYDRLKAAGIIDDNLKLVRHQKHNKKLDIESYLTGRYFAWTNNRDMERHTCDGIVRDMTDQFIAYLDKYMKLEKPKPEPTTRIIEAVDMDMETLIEMACTGDKNGAKFTALYRDGDLSGHNNDHSAADQALCNYLAFWFGKDPVKMDEAFRHSALMRPKWDEVHDGTRTYGEMTIQNAIDGQTDVYTGKTRVNTRNDAENGSESLSEPQTGDIFDMKVLRYELAQRNIKMRFNNMTQELVIDGLPDYVDPDKSIEYIITEIYGDMRRKYKYASLSTIGTLVNALATDMRIQYHPVLEYFKGKKWDKFDHLGRLYETLGIQDDELSKILVRKWFMQGWALLYNDPKKPYGADGVLTLAGGQGIGKTSFFKVMSINDADWFREGQAISEDKDTRMSALSAWICELGEIGCTFKSDMDSLKAFITDSKDRYRRHYAATPTKALRRTNLGGTVNGTEFLIDQTGNRRFWTVPLGDKNIAPLLYDPEYTKAEQIWLQVWEQYCEGNNLRECFRLTDEEQRMLAERNNKCEKPIEGEEQIKAIFDEAVSFDWMTLRDWMNRHDLRGQIREKYVRQILDKFGATVQDKKIDGKSKSVRWLPR